MKSRRSDDGKEIDFIVVGNEPYKVHISTDGDEVVTTVVTVRMTWGLYASMSWLHCSNFSMIILQNMKTSHRQIQGKI